MPYDFTYILVLIGLFITLMASLHVKTTVSKYSKINNMRGLTGVDAARMILESAGITDVDIVQIPGDMTDHYAPNEKVLRLSETVYDKCSVAAVGIAAHECGHAIQHKEGYAPLKLRSLSVPLAGFGSWISIPLIIIGFAFDLLGLAKLGIFFFAFVVAFQLITLPVEFNASRRAVTILENNGMLSSEELEGSKKVLSAAAMTYVAALLSSLLQLLRLVLIVKGGRRR